MDTLFDKEIEKYIPKEILSSEKDDTKKSQEIKDYLISFLRAISTYLPASIFITQLNENKLKRQWKPDGRFLPGTAMFADISGFTAMSEELSKLGKKGAEEVTKIVNDYFESMIKILSKYNGILLKFGGDAIIVFFSRTGFVSHNGKNIPDDAIRAVVSAIEMQKEMENFKEVKTSKGIFTLQMSIGINTGDVFAAEVGSEESRVEYIVTGRNINLTADAETAASARQIFIGQKTLDLLQPFVKTGIQKEGKYQGENCYEVLSLSIPNPPLTKPFSISDLPISLSDPKYLLASIKRLKPYLPAGVFEKIQSDPNRIEVEGEHRLVTVMFVNFWGLDYDNDPDVTDKLNTYFTKVQEVINKYGGVVNKVDIYNKGDKLMVLFGAPIAHEDDHERALRCALEMMDVVKTLQDTNLPNPIDIQQRIGINTGFVFAGNVGSSIRKEYTVMGDAVNLSARLMAVAQNGEIIISTYTERRIKEKFILEQLEPVKVKGKAEPIQIFKLKGVKEKETKLRRERKKIIGRDEEVKRIKSLIDEVINYKGQIVSIRGEAGIGKTRLLEEAVDYCLSKKMKDFTSVCQSYGKSVPYLPWIEILKEYFNILPNDDAQVSIKKIEQTLAKINGSLTMWLPLFGNLLSIQIDENDFTQALDARLRKQRLFDLIEQLIKYKANSTPIFLVIEDLQWADPTSIELLNYIAKGINNYRIMILITTRPELSFKVENKENNFTEIELKELTDDNSKSLASNLIGVTSIPKNLESLILQKSQGNPLFIEEVIKTLKENKLLIFVDGEWKIDESKGDVVIPDTINEVVMSRIDRLNEKTKNILQVASVIGRTFSKPLLSDIYSGGDITPNLAELGEMEIIYAITEEEYAFRQIMAQEVAYESLLFSRRKDLHQKIGNRLEVLYSANLDEQCELLSNHFYRGEEWEKASKYLFKSGEKASKVYANQDAINYFQKAIEASEKQLKDNVDFIISTREKLASVYEIIGEFDNADKNLELAFELTKDTIMKAELQRRLAVIHRKRGELNEAIEHLDKELPNLKEKGAELVLGRIYREKGVVYGLKNEFETAMSFYQQALQIFKNIETAKRDTAKTYNNISFIYQLQGKWKDALENSMKSLEIMEKEKAFLEIASIYNNIGRTYFEMGDWNKAIDYWEKSKEIEQKIGNAEGLARSYNSLGDVYRRKGDRQTSIEYFEKSIKMSEKFGIYEILSMSYGNISELYRETGDLDKALSYQEQALKISEKIGKPAGIAISKFNLGEIHKERGEWSLALNKLQNSLDEFEKLGFKPYLSYPYKDLGDLYLSLNNFDQALKYLLLAVESASKVGDKNNEGSTYILLGSFYSQTKEWDKAREYLNKANEIFSKIENEPEKANMLTQMAILFYNTGNIDSAEHTLDEAKSIAEKANLKSLLVKIYSLKAEFLLSNNQVIATEYIDKAIKIAEELNNAHLLGQVFCIKAKLENFKGNKETSSLYCQRGKEYYQKSADMIDDNELKEKYLASLGCYISPS